MVCVEKLVNNCERSIISIKLTTFLVCILSFTYKFELKSIAMQVYYMTLFTHLV